MSVRMRKGIPKVQPEVMIVRVPDEPVFVAGMPRAEQT